MRIGIIKDLNTKSNIVYRWSNMRARTYEYVIYAGDKPVLKGKNLKKLLKEAAAKYKDKKISIGWEAPEGVLIAKEEF